MAHRTILTARQRAALFDLPRDEATHLRFYVLSDDDMALIRRRRRVRNKLGFALQLCAFRYPGRLLQPGETIPESMLAFVGAQLGLTIDDLDGYGAREATRYQHSTALQRLYGYRPFEGLARDEMMPWLAAAAEHARSNEALARDFLSELRDRQIIVPSATTVERLCADALVAAERTIAERIAARLDPPARSRLLSLITEMVDGRVSRFVWLRRFEAGGNSADMNRLLDRLEALRTLGLSGELLDGIPVHRVDRLRGEGERLYVDGLRKLTIERRLAILVACTVSWRGMIADAAIETHDRIVGRLYRAAERRRDEMLCDQRRLVAETLQGFAKAGTALVAARHAGDDAYAAVERTTTWAIFEQLVADALSLTSRVEADPISFVAGGYPRFRLYAPRFLQSFDFKGSACATPILDAITVLRRMNAAGAREVPDQAPRGFVRPKWRRHVFPGGHADRRFWEICLLFELRNALRAGDIWIQESRRYGSIEQALLPPSAVRSCTRLAVPLTVDAWLDARKERLSQRLGEVGAAAQNGSLAGARISDGQLRIGRPDPALPKDAAALVARFYQQIPRIRITDLLLEVDDRVGFSEAFTNLRTGVPPRDRVALLTVLLADGVNLGLRKMADACAGYSFWELLRVADWHVREANYDQALAMLVEAQGDLPLARFWGQGETSSSDGQHFPAGGAGEAMNVVNARYGTATGVAFYTHLSDRYGPYHIGVIPATAHEAPYILDGLLRCEAGARIKEHYTDTGGFTDHVFAVSAILGYRFAPRIRDLADKRLYSFRPSAENPPLAPLIGGRINEPLIRAHWPDILRLAASMAGGAVVPSHILRKLAAYPRQNGLALALREVGRVERTLFILDWLSDTDLQRRAQTGLNKGEAHHALKRALFFNRLGELRDRTRENQAFRAAGVNLLAAAITYWNTLHLGQAAARSQVSGQPPEPEALSHLSPLGWEHIVLTGEYRWNTKSTPIQPP